MSVVERTRGGGSGGEGEEGPRGFVGGESDTWKFIKPTTTPSAGFLSYNAASSVATTAVYISEQDNQGFNAAAILNDWAAEDRLQILSPVTAGLYDLFLIESVASSGGVRKFKVTFLASSTGSPPYADNTVITVTVAHKGAKGESGSSGLKAKKPLAIVGEEVEIEKEQIVTEQVKLHGLLVNRLKEGELTEAYFSPTGTTGFVHIEKNETILGEKLIKPRMLFLGAAGTCTEYFGGVPTSTGVAQVALLATPNLTFIVASRGFNLFSCAGTLVWNEPPAEQVSATLFKFSTTIRGAEGIKGASVKCIDIEPRIEPEEGSKDWSVVGLYFAPKITQEVSTESPGWTAVECASANAGAPATKHKFWRGMFFEDAKNAMFEKIVALHVGPLTKGTVYNYSLYSEGATTEMLHEGPVKFGTTLKVAGAATLEGAATVGKTLKVKETLTAEAAAVVETTLQVKKTGTFEETVKIGKKLTVETQGLEVVKGTTTLKEGLTVEGAAKVENTLAVKETLKVNEEAKLEGKVKVGETLKVKEEATFEGDVIVEKTLKVTKAVTVEEELKANGGLKVVGALTLPNESITFPELGQFSNVAPIEVAAGKTYEVPTNIQGLWKENISVQGTLNIQGRFDEVGETESDSAILPTTVAPTSNVVIPANTQTWFYLNSTIQGTVNLQGQLVGIG